MISFLLGKHHPSVELDHSNKYVKIFLKKPGHLEKQISSFPSSLREGVVGSASLNAIFVL